MNRIAARRRTVWCGLLACAVLAAVPAGASFAQQLDAAGTIAAENAALTARLAEDSAALERAAADLARLRKSRDELDAAMRRIEETAQAHARGRELARTMGEELRALPRPARFTDGRQERRRILEASDATLHTERSLRELGDLDAAVAGRLAAVAPSSPQTDRPQLAAEVRKLLVEQRSLLTRLGELQKRLVQTLRETRDARRERDRRALAARTELNRLLFRSPVPPGTRTVGELAPSLVWTVSPANWRAAGVVVRDEAARSPFWPALALLIAAGLYAARPRLKRALVSSAPAAVGDERYRAGHALAALAVTLALAAPAPLVMWTAGTLLESAPDTQRFAQSLGDALTRLAPLPFVLYALAWLLDRRGMAVGHFGWDEASLAFAARALRRFAALFVPLMFVTALNGLEHAPFANRESLGRFCLILAMITLAASVVHLLRRRSPLLQRLVARDPHGWPVRLHAAWFGALVAFPVAVAAVAVAGYFVAAGYFYGRMVYSAFIVLGALILYGLIALWVQRRGAALVRRRGEAAERPAAPGAEGAAAGGTVATPPSRLDVTAIGEQARSLLELFLTLLVLGGLWVVWIDAVPMLSAISEYRLWTYTETVDGKAVTHALTVGGLFLALVVVAVTAIAVRNVGALLDIVLLQRLEMQADATYAIKVVARYVLTAAGVVVASGVLGIGWSDVQWLVAALSVGLGFGLQEIFSNIVSGLIVLAERPIRIGDVVTVGDVSGTVARIRARATTVIDFDNKEVLIPNKSFITDRVINWTLSNQTTRLLLKIGVPAGTDVALAQQVMLGAVQRNPDVLRVPTPSVLLTAVGASSLDFEIHAFVGSFEKRLPVQHELNLAVDGALREHGISSTLAAPAGVGPQH
jgi:potassium efflux system protein